ncbi:hypothetical protein ACQP25_05300 [Microtetraspora malaysiensis]
MTLVTNSPVMTQVANSLVTTLVVNSLAAITRSRTNGSPHMCRKKNVR